MALVLCFHRLALQGSHLKTARNSPRSLVHLLESAHRDMCKAIKHCTFAPLANPARNRRIRGQRCGTHAYEDGHVHPGLGKQNHRCSRGSLAVKASEGDASSLSRFDQGGSQCQEDIAFMSEALEEARQVPSLKQELPVLRSAL